MDSIESTEVLTEASNLRGESTLEAAVHNVINAKTPRINATTPQCFESEVVDWKL